MALAFRTLCRNRYNYSISNITQPVKIWSVKKIIPIRILASGICYRNNIPRPLGETKYFSVSRIRQCSTQDSSKPQEPVKKLSLIQRLKQMYIDYWYVAVPVHMATSAIWFGGFYYAVRSGVDVIAILQSLGVSEHLITQLKESSAGYYALTFALYKLATPLRYTVTVGCTTYAINKLTAIGWIKPVPSKKRIKEMYQERKDNLQESIKESKAMMKEKRITVMDEIRRYKTEMRNIKNKVKKM